MNSTFDDIYPAGKGQQLKRNKIIVTSIITCLVLNVFYLLHAIHKQLPPGVLQLSLGSMSVNVRSEAIVGRVVVYLIDRSTPIRLMDIGMYTLILCIYNNIIHNIYFSVVNFHACFHFGSA